MDKNKIIIILAFLPLFLFNAKYVFAVSCSQVGDMTYCTDGTSYSRVGDNIYGSNGTEYSQLGNTTYQSNCPYNSSPDPSKITPGDYGVNCKCNNGFVTSGGKCVSAYSVCSSKLGNNSSYDSVTNTCRCDSGYVIGSTGQCMLPAYSPPAVSVITPVIPIPIQQSGTLCNGKYWNACPVGNNFVCPSTGNAYCEIPKTNDQICNDTFVLNSIWNGTKNDKGGLVCDCKTGYQWNNGRTACVVNAPIPTPAQNQTLSGIFANSVQKVTPTNGYRVKAGDTLYDLYGDNWKILSGYPGDPTQLKVGTVLNSLPN